MVENNYNRARTGKSARACEKQWERELQYRRYKCYRRWFFFRYVFFFLCFLWKFLSIPASVKFSVHDVRTLYITIYVYLYGYTRRGLWYVTSKRMFLSSAWVPDFFTRAFRRDASVSCTILHTHTIRIRIGTSARMNYGSVFLFSVSAFSGFTVASPTVARNFTSQRRPVRCARIFCWSRGADYDHRKLLFFAHTHLDTLVAGMRQSINRHGKEIVQRVERISFPAYSDDGPWVSLVRHFGAILISVIFYLYKLPFIYQLSRNSQTSSVPMYHTSCHSNIYYMYYIPYRQMHIIWLFLMNIRIAQSKLGCI